MDIQARIKAAGGLLDKRREKLYSASCVTHATIKPNKKMRTAGSSFATNEELFSHLSRSVLDGQSVVILEPEFEPPFTQLERLISKIGGYQVKAYDCNHYLGMLPAPRVDMAEPIVLQRLRKKNKNKADELVNRHPSPPEPGLPDLPKTVDTSDDGSDEAEGPIILPKQVNVSMKSTFYVVASQEGGVFIIGLFPKGMAMQMLVAVRSAAAPQDTLAFQHLREKLWIIHTNDIKTIRRIRYVNGPDAEIPDISFADVILPSKFKNRLIQDVKAFFSPEARKIYRELSVPYKRGFLFTGPPGNGKTTFIKALAHELDVTVWGLVARSDIRDYHFEDLIRMASQNAPAICFIEDVGRIWRDNKNISKSAFLNLLDGVMEIDGGVLIIGTDNHPEEIDPALTSRPSRFDKIYHFPDAGPKARAALMTKLGRGYFTPQAIQQVSVDEGFSMAMAKEVIMQAFLFAATEQRDPMDQDLIRAYEDVWEMFGKKKAKKRDDFGKLR